ncbi:MAG: DUF2975 domain-containing protein [Clostridia bacterium]|nr:DUF2975 domain-containing protein [Clostridia bacterium]
MLKCSKQVSLYLSLGIATVFFLVCIVGLFVLPTLTEMLIDLPDNVGDRDSITEGGRVLVLAVAYGVVAVFMLADGLLFALLLRVKRGLVFSAATVSLIRGVAWCCFLLCVLFSVLGRYFQLAFLVAFLAAFLGLCLRVVKNVIEEATAIKAEQDLTV